MPMQKLSEDQIRAMIAHLAFPEYTILEECRCKVDDCLAGQKTIKSKEKYLPPNDWQKEHLEQYISFLNRALFPGETRYSLDIYEGLFSLGEPHITLPADNSMDFIVKNASVYGDGLKNIQMRLNSEQMSHGLRCLLLETKKNSEEPFVIKEYTAGKFLRSHFVDMDGESIADFILVDESTDVYNTSTFSDEVEYKLRIFALDINGEYYQRKVYPNEIKRGFDILNPPLDDRTIYPDFNGVRFNRIPFVWCGAHSLSGSSFDYPPLLSMADTEIALYMAMANHSQHIYMNTQEILVFSGVAPESIDKNMVLGCGSYLCLKNANAKAEYVSTNGVGYTAERDEISQLKNDIEQKRLSLMSAKSHQSGTVVGLVQNSQSAPLRSIVNTSGNAVTLILQYMARWMRKSKDEIESIRYIPSQMFANSKVNLAEFIALCQAVNNGEVKMLEKQLYDMAKESGYINSSLTWEQFKVQYDIEDAERKQKNGVLPQTAGNPFSEG